jgi:hypothetical protein
MISLSCQDKNCQRQWALIEWRQWSENVTAPASNRLRFHVSTSVTHYSATLVSAYGKRWPPDDSVQIDIGKKVCLQYSRVFLNHCWRMDTLFELIFYHCCMCAYECTIRKSTLCRFLIHTQSVANGFWGNGRETDKEAALVLRQRRANCNRDAVFCVVRYAAVNCNVRTGFPVRSKQMPYNEKQLRLRDNSRRRRQKGTPVSWDSEMWSQVLQDLDPRVQGWQGSIALVGVIYRPFLSPERAPHTKKNGKCLKIISVDRKKNLSRVPDGGLIPGQTGRPTVCRKLTLTTTLITRSQ